MKTSPLFTPPSEAIDTLIALYPLAQVVSVGPDGLVATPLPLLLDRAEDGRVTLLGHFARANTQAAALGNDPHALAIFNGPHGYISPSWFTDRTQAPTWNFTAVHARVRIALDFSEGAARGAVDRLTAHMERGRPNAWHPDDMGERYAKLIKHVVAFRAEVLGWEVKFKLGQNERPDVDREAIAGLEAEGAGMLAGAMKAAKRERMLVLAGD